MPRTARNETDFAGHDSFLDIVANIVGILIILVIVVGVRARNMPVCVDPVEVASAAARDLEADRAVAASLQADLDRTDRQLQAVWREAEYAQQQSAELAATVAARQKELRARREQLDVGGRRQFDLGRAVSEARTELERLERQRAELDAAPTEPVVIESYPTPLSRRVDGDELHVQLRDGFVAVVPLDELIERLKASARRQAYKLRHAPELVDTVGPLGGFRLRYRLRRHDVPLELQVASGQGGTFVKLKRWTLIPTARRLGEPAETALREGSALREAISKLRPGRTTVTIWVYPDSFAAFRQLRETLYHSGFAVAGRPLPHGVPITGSPDGSRSAAQ